MLLFSFGLNDELEMQYPVVCAACGWHSQRSLSTDQVSMVCHLLPSPFVVSFWLDHCRVPVQRCLSFSREITELNHSLLLPDG